MSTNRPSRVAVLLVLGLLASFFVAPGTTAAADPMTISQAELAMVDALNVDRTTRGLVPVRIDSRLMAIARGRSADMAAKDYFSHTQPDGRNVFDIITAKKITWYGAGEIIAWNNYPTLATSVAAANNQWLNSPDHKAIVVSTSYNYVGVGLALGTNGKKIWTAVYMRGPDLTGAKAKAATPTVANGATSDSKRVTVTWSGGDVPLQVLTSGFHSYQIQRRVDGGSWKMVWIGTTRKSMTLDLATNHTYEFRVAARDKAGNWGAWSLAKATLAAGAGSVVVSR
jgi:uncharacterized protein YkwD